MSKIAATANRKAGHKAPRSREPLRKRSVPVSQRKFFGQQFVYCVISQRAMGLSIGINMNPDQSCNFDCVYCEIDRSEKRLASQVDCKVMIQELQQTLQRVNSGSLHQLEYHDLPRELLELKEVALSGDGEPTICPNFLEVVKAVVKLRTLGPFPYFKIVLITNCTGLHLPDVQAGVALLTDKDEVWAKLEVGTREYMRTVNRTYVPLKLVLNNILDLAKKRPVVIQSLFAQINRKKPPVEEVVQYAKQLRKLKAAGANIPLVQIYSAHRPAMSRDVAHLPLRTLSSIAKRVREISGLRTEVF